MKERLVNLETLDFETSQEVSLRPNLWEDYIGQEKIKSNLQISIQAAKKRQESLDHMLFFGPPGLGKTSISHIIAKEMETNIKITAAPMIEKSGDLAAILTNLQAKDILFIDEIHRLSPAIEEILYPAMEDFRLDIIIGSGPAAQTIKIDLPPFTLIGATTRAGMLSNPLRDRFGMSFRMQFYSPSELTLIIKKAALKLNQSIEEESANEIAKRSRGTPRIALRLLKRVRDFALVKNSSLMDLNITLHALNELGVNELGFDEADLMYLSLLANAQGKPVGLNTIAASMREDENTIEDVIEPFLLANGYLERTARGRIATPKTYTLLKIPTTNPATLF
ncbi:Holliday junction branch migration DNA helicase RuvB [Helicobacter cetorum]|uniref:Holliday junction branch migration complex subunit RuvB n=1 Tax=Helicobacter cetorum (strain ATCC BAA-540 / CCUG 52418 / MIT 99-5656) TaxID=1163745 RepID=I0EUI8_HELCM|nr:Holliday junction branch migration DNA helicase RuvB [Helicobacter cetorum]AFI06607.1 Holliday junction DNA helicase RuvB [Helicobacter cetorum MIT 99-5656]